MPAADDLGVPLVRSDPVRRLVSLVPSLTEAVAATRAEAIVGTTDWCSRPASLDVARVRGTKNPDVAAIIELSPDVVIANREENRKADVIGLRAAGVDVWVTVIETVPQALASMRRLFVEALRWDVPDWLDEVTVRWTGDPPEPHTSVAVPIWRDPWMVVGSGTYTGDLLARLGYRNVFADHADRYPRCAVAEIDDAGADVILLPDEPYEFDATDGPEAFERTPTRLVPGRLITWYGPSLLEVDAAMG